MAYRLVSVIGSSSVSAEIEQLAEDLGRELALRGFSVVCGGRSGVMEAVSRGAQAGKAEFKRAHADQDPPVVIGILPSSEHSDGNPYLDVILPTGLGFARNSVVALAANAVVAVKGGAGTLSEMAYAWDYKKPIVALSVTGGWAAKLAGERIDDRRGDTVLSATTPREAVDLVEQALRAP